MFQNVTNLTEKLVIVTWSLHMEPGEDFSPGPDSARIDLALPGPVPGPGLHSYWTKFC